MIAGSDHRTNKKCFFSFLSSTSSIISLSSLLLAVVASILALLNERVLLALVAGK